MKSLLSISFAALVSLSSFAALADVPNPPNPCDGLSAGDACTDADTNKTGTCKADPACTTTGCLVCNTSASTGTGGGSNGGETGGGCAVAPLGLAGAAPLVAALALLGASTLRRRRAR